MIFDWTPRKYCESRMLVISIATVMEKPYAAVMASDVRNQSCTAMQPTHSSQLMLGT